MQGRRQCLRLKGVAKRVVLKLGLTYHGAILCWRDEDD